MPRPAVIGFAVSDLRSAVHRRGCCGTVNAEPEALIENRIGWFAIENEKEIGQTILRMGNLKKFLICFKIGVRCEKFPN